MNQHRVLTEPTKLLSKPNQKGPGNLIVWAFQLEGLGEVVLYKKEGNDPPRSGQVLAVEDHWDVKENGRPFKRVKLAYNPHVSQTASKGSGDDYSRRPDHPDNVARMRHTTALSAAPKYIEQMLTIGVIDQPANKAEYVELVSGVVAWLEGTYLPAPPSPQSDVPADMDGLNQGELDESGVPWESARA